MFEASQLANQLSSNNRLKCNTATSYADVHHLFHKFDLAQSTIGFLYSESIASRVP